MDQWSKNWHDIGVLALAIGIPAATATSRNPATAGAIVVGLAALYLSGELWGRRRTNATVPSASTTVGLVSTAR
jgi:hypothetical protein